MGKADIYLKMGLNQNRHGEMSKYSISRKRKEYSCLSTLWMNNLHPGRSRRGNGASGISSAPSVLTEGNSSSCLGQNGFRQSKLRTVGAGSKGKQRRLLGKHEEGEWILRGCMSLNVVMRKRSILAKVRTETSAAGAPIPLKYKGATEFSEFSPKASILDGWN